MTKAQITHISKDIANELIKSFTLLAKNYHTSDLFKTEVERILVEDPKWSNEVAIIKKHILTFNTVRDVLIESVSEEERQTLASPSYDRVISINGECYQGYTLYLPDRRIYSSDEEYV